MNKAERIYQELLQERANIWYISDHYGSKIMLKVSSSILKAIIKGCKLELLFGVDNNIFHIGINIYDDPVNFATITSTNRIIDEHLSIAKIMQLDNVQIQLYNELCACQCFGTITLSSKQKNDILCLLGNPRKLFTGTLSERIYQSADNFQFSLGLDMPGSRKSQSKIETVIVETKIEAFQMVQNSFIDNSGNVSTEISDLDEGALFEKEIFIALRSLFGLDLYHSPQIAHNKSKYRELIDILTLSEFGIFLIEAKALGVTSANEERNMERKVKGLQKQIEKAIYQLGGAYKKIVENEAIYNSKGEEIFFKRNLPSCGIIIVSELLPFGSWDEIIKKLLITMSEKNILIHIMDLNEIMLFIGHSQGNINLFDTYLMERMEDFIKIQA
ncbi:nuclease-related domain-containing protein [Chryseobacterium gambrini]|uniref:Nuclease-related domain-containing protein n=1 Tax=Chryseobacterium gambrini TaxID=373672 RepID=A0A1N7KQJ9_9FLAO|nr:nuclease-related domain-containing protein [Chryseobacterium gambrini]SIS63825.1 hypothetical protein SAMN05421785_101663 [Chryseobacterium gambrini]